MKTEDDVNLTVRSLRELAEQIERGEITDFDTLHSVHIEDTTPPDAPPGSFKTYRPTPYRTFLLTYTRPHQHPRTP